MMNLPTLQNSVKNQEATTNPAKHYAVTELLIPKQQDSDAIVAPLVASLSRQQDQRWLTWITHRAVSKAMLQALGAKLERVRIIHTSQKADNRWLIWEALTQGNSHTLIADTEVLDKADIEQLEAAATVGSASAICIREAC